LRESQFKKNQYGPMGETIVLRYQHGLFLPEGGISSLDKAARDIEAESTVLEFVKRKAQQNQALGPNPTASNYGPTVIAKEAKGFRKAELETAMQRLINAHRMHIRSEGPPSKQRKYLAPGAAA